MPLITSLERLRQKDFELQTSMVYIARPYSKQTNKQTKIQKSLLFK
jgi:hypothetical protein